MNASKRVVMIAHDNRKHDLLDWAAFNVGTLSRHDLSATGTTGLLLEEALGLHVHRFLSGPLGRRSADRRGHRRGQGRPRHLLLGPTGTAAARRRREGTAAHRRRVQHADRLQPLDGRLPALEPADGRALLTLRQQALSEARSRRDRSARSRRRLPGKNRASWPVSPHLTVYGGPPSGPTPMISASRSGSPTWSPLDDDGGAPTLACMVPPLTLPTKACRPPSSCGRSAAWGAGPNVTVRGADHRLYSCARRLPDDRDMDTPTPPLVLTAADVAALPLVPLDPAIPGVAPSDPVAQPLVDRRRDADRRWPPSGQHAHRANHHHMWIVDGAAEIVGSLVGPGGYVHIPAGVEHDLDARGQPRAAPSTTCTYRQAPDGLTV